MYLCLIVKVNNNKMNNAINGKLAYEKITQLLMYTI